MNVHILQHVSFEGPGSIEDWCLANGHAMSVTPLYMPSAVLPDLAGVHLLVIMGGPMSVYDDGLFPWLVAEKRFIRDFLATGKPVLGICLGAQLLALCCGVRVERAPHVEIGWFPVAPSPAAAAVPWLCSLLAPKPVLFHWHGDRFEIPGGATNLAMTEANDNQAFVLNECVVGLQFHPEITPGLLEQMVAEGRHELTKDRFVQSADRILGHAEYRDGGKVIRGVLSYLESLVKQK